MSQAVGCRNKLRGKGGGGTIVEKQKQKQHHQKRELSGSRRDEHGEREINPPKSGRGFSKWGGKTATKSQFHPLLTSK